jgi:hypothetical protein
MLSTLPKVLEEIIIDYKNQMDHYKKPIPRMSDSELQTALHESEKDYHVWKDQNDNQKQLNYNSRRQAAYKDYLELQQKSKS